MFYVVKWISDTTSFHVKHIFDLTEFHCFFYARWKMSWLLMTWRRYGVRASATIMLTWLSRMIPASAENGQITNYVVFANVWILIHAIPWIYHKMYKGESEVSTLMILLIIYLCPLIWSNWFWINSTLIFLFAQYRSLCQQKSPILIAVSYLDHISNTRQEQLPSLSYISMVNDILTWWFLLMLIMFVVVFRSIRDKPHVICKLDLWMIKMENILPLWYKYVYDIHVHACSYIRTHSLKVITYVWLVVTGITCTCHQPFRIAK